MSDQSPQRPADDVPRDDRRMGPPNTRGRRSRSSILWFVWMVGMWLAFYGLLFAGEIDELWNSIRDLPLVVEIVLWIALLPWMLGMAVWTSSWAAWIRVVLVVCFAVGWTVISLPRRPGTRPKPRP